MSLLTHLLPAEGQLSHLCPVRSPELLHPHPLVQAHPQGSQLGVSQALPGLGPSSHRPLPGPEAPGRAESKCRRWLYRPHLLPPVKCQTHDFTSLGLSLSSVKWGCRKDLTPSPLRAWMAPAASYLAALTHSWPLQSVPTQ